ncbi:rhodanese-like domain-containing protein [Aeoliella sp. SH292]|uniref:rhodanese-like domain-containing protein n=1 Tax=Aeoliella sp. SH292 TaxID=3454464 RepID=UPI003F9A5905
MLSSCTIALLLAAILATSAHAEPTTDSSVPPTAFTTPKLDWQPGPAAYPKGATMAKLLGDPATEGPYLVWIKLPDGFELPPYFHATAERLTVLSGKLHVGAGDKFDKQATTPLIAGQHAEWPSGVNHFALAEGETLIQLHGEGPWVMNYVNPKQDPRHPRQRNVIEHTTDSLETIKARVAEGKAVLVDVRTIGEWNTMHLANSTHLPETSLGRGSLDLDKVAKILPAKSEEKILYAYCVVGMRAKKAAKVLQEQGYNVRAVKPGIDEFVEAGFEKADESSR